MIKYDFLSGHHLFIDSYNFVSWFSREWLNVSLSPPISERRLDKRQLPADKLVLVSSPIMTPEKH
jgi:hypothetical protein